MNDPSNTRRKILQGSLAAPLVLTVSSAAQAASSFTQCIENTANSQPPDALRIIQSTDQWFRCPVTVYRYLKDGTTGDFVDVYSDGGVYKKVSDGTTFTTSGYTQVSTTSWNRLVYFGTDGTPKGAGWEKQTGGLAVTLSCGGSFGITCAP